MDSEYIYALQSWYLPKYADLFKVIAYLGGCITQQQLTRLLFQNKTDCVSRDRLVRKLLDAKLLKVEKLGGNNILLLTYPVFRYLDIQRTAKISGTRLKLSALILEKYLRLRIYNAEHPAMALKDRLEKTSALSYLPTGVAHMRQMHYLTTVFAERGLCTDGLQYQYRRAEKRMEHCFRKEYDKAHRLGLSKEPDLFGLECKNIYLTGVRMRQGPYGKEHLEGIVDVYHISNLTPAKLTSYIIEAKRVIESTLQNDSTALIHIYSHGAEDTAYMDQVYAALEQYPEFVLPDTAREQVTFHFFDTKAALFSNIDPDRIR